jgi:hypothetical protein
VKHPNAALPHLVPQEGPIMEQWLSVNQAAELLGTTVRFARRLVAEPWARFIPLVATSGYTLDHLIRAGTVKPAGGATKPR